MSVNVEACSVDVNFHCQCQMKSWRKKRMLLMRKMKMTMKRWKERKMLMKKKRRMTMMMLLRCLKWKDYDGFVCVWTSENGDAGCRGDDRSLKTLSSVVERLYNMYKI